VTAADRSKRPASGGRSALSYVLIAASVWLGWEVLKAPMVDRAPPRLALRLAPGAPEVLRRAAEGELLQEDWKDAAWLSDRSLGAAPFNARALRVRGLAEARTGDPRRADQLLTLAGNWSLRDDPAHAWLVEHRLRQGSYASAFGHADTLARRRRDLHDQVFDLFSTAALEDSRAIPALVDLLAADPPWRTAYLVALQRKEDADALLLSLGVALQATKAPLTDAELSRIYRGWVRERRYAAVGALRRELGRPALAPEVQNGDFSLPVEAQLSPLGWTLGAAAGLVVQITEDDLAPENRALRIDFDGYRTAPVASQLLLLQPGAYTFSVRYRRENVSSASFEWVLTCVEGGAPLMRSRLPETTRGADTEWRDLRADLKISTGCTAQRLRLAPRAADRRAPLAVWFDDVAIQPSAESRSG